MIRLTASKYWFRVPLVAAVVAAFASSHASGHDGENQKALGEPSSSQAMVAEYDEQTGTVDLRQGDVRILRYNHKAISAPSGFFEGFPPGSDIPGIRKIAVARSGYIHPLFDPNGKTQLTDDWPRDHLHHRGIYWAWPEVTYGGQTGDQHALLKVFTRPSENLSTASSDRYVEVNAENHWYWEDRTPIVRETVGIRAWRSTKDGRFIDLTFTFTALEEKVFIARRDTTGYGGLNVRLRHLAEERIRTPHQTDADSAPHRNWGDWTGRSAEGDGQLGLAIFEHPQNPDYPGDWQVYPELPWLQPCFPRGGTRYQLVPGEELALKYRLWVHRGQPNDAQLDRAFDAYVAATTNEPQDDERDNQPSQAGKHHD